MRGHRPAGSLHAHIKGFLLSLGGVALVLLGGIAASWPLWYMATRHATAYLILTMGTALGFVLRSVYRRKRTGTA